jgi:Zn-dependent peptidase ImmA (M78 family)
MFERGFKTWCEKRSAEARKDLGLKPYDKLDPYALAERLKIRVWNVEDVPGLSERSKRVLTSPTEKGSAAWSGVTLLWRDKKLVILNSSHSVGRRSNDLMHEIAHFLLGHSPCVLPMSTQGLALRQNYDRQQEQEADWLGACMLLPRPALVRIKRAGVELQQAAADYGVSRALLSYRLAITGVNAQFG